MKTLQTTPYYAPAWGHGGPPRVLYELDRELVRRGHEVTVYTTDHMADPGRSVKEFDVIDGIKVHYFRNFSHWAVSSLAKILTVPIGYRAALVRTTSYFDVIHIVGARDYLTFNAFRVAKKQNIPYVNSAFGCLPQSGGVTRPIKVILDKIFVYAMIKSSAGLIAQTEHEARLYKAFGGRPESIVLIPLGVDLPELESLPQRGIFRSEFGIPPQRKLIVSLGRIHKLKGFDTLVKAVRHLVDTDTNICLAIVGRDEGDLGRVKKLVREMDLVDHVIFTGPLYDQERFLAYVDADVFALTPKHFEETFLASLEACACGRQVVVTEQADIPWLKSHDAGLVVKHDVQEISNALRQSLADLTTIQERGRNARRMIQERFTWDALAHQYERVFETAAARKQVSHLFVTPA